jgi:hypothetical protein
MNKVSDVVCSDPTCDESHKDHRWGKIKAGSSGWFMSKDGSSWCPKHIPDWVKEWRVKNANS